MPQAHPGGGRYACGADKLRRDESTRDSSFGVPGVVPKTAPHRGTGKEGFAHIWRDEFQARMPPLIRDHSVNISRLVSLLDAPPDDPAQSSEDLAALAWIHPSSEDVEATIIGLPEMQRRRTAAFRNPAPFSTRDLVT